MLDSQEYAEYKVILEKHGFGESDFSISKVPADVGIGHGFYKPQKLITIARRSNGAHKKYQSIDSEWLDVFDADLVKKAFG